MFTIVPRVRSIQSCGADSTSSELSKGSQFSQIHPSPEFSYLLDTPVLERDAARQRGGEQPTVLRPAFEAAGESGRIPLEAEGCNSGSQFSHIQLLVQGCGYFDVLLRALVRHPFLGFSCALLPPFNSSFASGSLRRLLPMPQFPGYARFPMDRTSGNCTGRVRIQVVNPRWDCLFPTWGPAPGQRIRVLHKASLPRPVTLFLRGGLCPQVRPVG
jgi:hypothetical protein